MTRQYNIWFWISAFITTLVLIPIVTLFVNIFSADSEVWDHLVETVLTSYITNTLLVALGTVLLALIFGISTAWCVSVFNFPGRKFFSWALILPLSIPGYVAAYTYAGIFDFTSPVQTYTRDLLGIQTMNFDVMTMENIILILSVCLFPYVYIICKNSFSKQSSDMLDAARILGQSKLKSFFTIALPLARPAIVSGAVIVIMEVLNDYGAMKYYGINTFTVSICQVWFSFNDVNSAIKLSMYLMLIVLIFIVIELLFRGRAKYSSSNSSSKPLERTRLKGFQAFIIFLICFTPLLIGFIIPVIQLTAWSCQTAHKVINKAFWQLVQNSFLLAIFASAFTVLLGILLTFSVRASKNKLSKLLSKVASIGYILPGAVAAVGVIIPFIFIHNNLIQLIKGYDIMRGLIVGSFIALGFAYFVRFLVLALNPMDSTMEKVSSNIDDAARVLGASNLKTFFKINLPILKNAILGAFILIFVNVLKEIPLTIILRPFNFDTLAIKGFELAKNEQIAESANLSLIIVIAGLIPILFLNKLMTEQKG